jgi:hypothetical protein
MNTIIEIKHPFAKIPFRKWQKGLPWIWRFHWLFTWGGGSVSEFGGSRVNTTRHLTLFGYHVLTVHRNEYHDRSDAERADEYLRKWSECEKELRGLRLIMLGDESSAEVKKLIRDSLGIDLDEGRIL